MRTFNFLIICCIWNFLLSRKGNVVILFSCTIFGLVVFHMFYHFLVTVWCPSKLELWDLLRYLYSTLLTRMYVEMLWKEKSVLENILSKEKNTYILRTSSKKYACTSKHLPGTVKNNVSSLHQAIVQFPFVYMATKEQFTGQAMKDCLSKLMHQLRTLHMSTIGR